MYEIESGYRIFQGQDVERFPQILGRLVGAVHWGKWYFEPCAFTGPTPASRAFDSPEDAETAARKQARPQAADVC